MTHFKVGPCPSVRETTVGTPRLGTERRRGQTQNARLLTYIHLPLIERTETGHNIEKKESNVEYVYVFPLLHFRALMWSRYEGVRFLTYVEPLRFSPNLV